MRDVPETLMNAWLTGHFVGDQRPQGRVTISHPTMKLHHYGLLANFAYKKATDVTDITVDPLIDYTKRMHVSQTYADFMFSHLGKPMELPNVQSISWSRSIDADVADCTIEMTNSKILEPGDVPFDDELDIPGYYSYARGATRFSRSRWHQTINDWFGMLMPDNIIRTYEGYGSDFTVAPELDPYLVQTGVWIIDDVTTSADGTISIKCRDIGRILMDQIFYPPVVPSAFYDEGWQAWDKTFTTAEGGRLPAKAVPVNSNSFWTPSGIVQGHSPANAWDGNDNTYWISIGNDRPSRRYAYEWVEATVGSRSVDSVELRTKKSGYIAYVSVMVGGLWQGTGKIDYHRDGIGRNGADINYVTSVLVPSEQSLTIKLPKTYAKVQRVRITLGNLQYFPGFGTYHYRAAIRSISLHGTTTTTTKVKTGYTGANPGYYRDYTDLVKLFCAWGGFFWPKDGQQRICNPPGTDPQAVIPGYDDTKNVRPAHGDKTLGQVVSGRVWGDFQQTGTTGIYALDSSNFDKKSLMDCITYIRDILGFIFFIDETGGVQWRLPNMTNKGNLVSTISAKPGYKKGVIHYASDTAQIISLSSAISAANVREAYFVGDSAGQIAAFSPGFNPNPTGLRRFAGWTDAGFAPETNTKGESSAAQVKAAQAQAELMADMLSLRQLFTYRVNKVTIPANPAIQMDDQIRLAERVTSEGYIHYIRGISSSLDLQAGTWTYDLDTNWLGYDPGSQWLFHPEQFRKGSANYIRLMKAQQAAQNYAYKRTAQS